MNYAELTIEGLSKQDSKVVKENPNASLDELMQLGLTDKGVTTIRDFESRIRKVKPAPAKPVSVQQQVASPKPTKRGVPIANRRTGRTVYVSEKAGKRLLGKLNSSRGMGNNYGQNYQRGQSA